MQIAVTSDFPTAWPASFSHCAVVMMPPNVPRSVIDALVPQKRMPRPVASQIHHPQHLPALVEPRGDPVGSAKHSGWSVGDDVTHPATLPKNG